ncbi:MAG: hypothetical protein HYT80_07580 [Euryarchaeota archaeon]|nr:hypothetical protein [Euryarchaeota archaeon]
MFSPPSTANGKPDCNDRRDNDGDGAADYPEDPGCSGRGDPSEHGTDACDDGIDNDEDGTADTQDAGCASPTDASEVAEYAPFHDLADAVNGLELLSVAEGPRGYRARAYGDRAYVTTSTSAQGIVIYDISDPAAPERIGAINVGAWRTYEALDVMHYDEGDRTVVVASLIPLEGVDHQVNGSVGPIGFWDVTDPTNVTQLALIEGTSHGEAFHPQTHTVYGRDVIIDASDPNDIRVHRESPHLRYGGEVLRNGTFACHIPTVDAAHNRLYCPASRRTIIVDISDPLNPVQVDEIFQADANGVFCCDHTYAVPLLEGTVLAISAGEGDCVQTPPGTEFPTGRLWFYDLTTSPPAFLSVLKVPAVRTSPGCVTGPTEGSEVGSGTGLLAFGWQREGIVLVDASEPRHPVMLSMDNSQGVSRDAFYYRGLVFGTAVQSGLVVMAPVGDHTRPVGTCSDGIDNDGDGLVDFPADVTGCRSAEDDEGCVRGTNQFGQIWCDTTGMDYPFG